MSSFYKVTFADANQVLVKAECLKKLERCLQNTRSTYIKIVKGDLVVDVLFDINEAYVKLRSLALEARLNSVFLININWAHTHGM